MKTRRKKEIQTKQVKSKKPSQQLLQQKGLLKKSLDAKTQQKIKSKRFPLYDQLFKDVYSYIQYAIELLKDTLSKSELAILKLSGMRLEKESFSKGLRGDLLFTIPLKAIAKLRIPFVILFEHKSRFSYEVLSQILHYMVEVIDFYAKKTGQKVIPPMIAIVFSHDKKIIKEPLTLQDLLPKEWLKQVALEKGKGPFSSLSRDMLNYRLRVYNVHDPKRCEQWKHLKSRMALELFRNKKLFKSKDEAVLEKELVELFQGLKKVEKQDILLSSAQYHLSKRNPKIDLRFFKRCVKLAYDKDPSLIKVKGGNMGNYVPLLERGIAEGLAKGLAKGRAEGMEKGMEKGLQMLQTKEKNVVLSMLKDKMSLQAIVKYTGVSKNRVLKIKKEAGL